MKILGVVSANDHGESVLKAEWLGDFEVKALGVKLPDAIVDGGGITSRRFVQDGGEGGAGVFNVEVELSSLEGSVDEERAAEIGFASDGDASARFDVLGEQLSENDLLREKFGADGDFRLRGLMASREEVSEAEKIQKTKKSETSATHVRRPLAFVRGGPGENRQAGRGERQGWRRLE